MGIHRTVEALRDTIHGEDISVEEDAAFVGAICCRVAAIIGRFGVTILGTGRRIISLCLTEGMVFVTHVGVLTLSVQRGVDGTSKLSRTCVA